METTVNFSRTSTDGAPQSRQSFWLQMIPSNLTHSCCLQAHYKKRLLRPTPSPTSTFLQSPQPPQPVTRPQSPFRRGSSSTAHADMFSTGGKRLHPSSRALSARPSLSRSCYACTTSLWQAGNYPYSLVLLLRFWPL